MPRDRITPERDVAGATLRADPRPADSLTAFAAATSNQSVARLARCRRSGSADATAHPVRSRFATSALPVLARSEPNSTSAELPAPLTWEANKSSGGEIRGSWGGPPAFSPRASESDAQSAKAAFTTAWGTAQTSYNQVGAKMALYDSAAQDAQLKGLVVGAGSGSVDQQLEDATMPTAKKKVGQAFGSGGAVGGKDNYHADKVPDELRQKITKAKEDIATKDDALAGKADDILLKLNGVKTTRIDAHSLKLGLDELKDEGAKKRLEPHVTAIERSKALIEKTSEQAASTMGADLAEKGGKSKQKTSTGALAELGLPVIGTAINVLWLDPKLQEIEGHVAMLDGSLQACKELKQHNEIDKNKIALQSALIELKKATRDYNGAIRDRNAAYRDLSQMIGEAAGKSGATPDEQKRIQAAIQAVPAIEYVLSIITQVTSVINAPSADNEARVGFALATTATQAEMRGRVGELTATKDRMGDLEKTWAQRLAGARKAMDAAV